MFFCTIDVLSGEFPAETIRQNFKSISKELDTILFFEASENRLGFIGGDFSYTFDPEIILDFFEDQLKKASLHGPILFLTQWESDTTGNSQKEDGFAADNQLQFIPVQDLVKRTQDGDFVGSDFLALKNRAEQKNTSQLNEL